MDQRGGEPMVARLRLSARLRRYRTAAGSSRTEAAAAIGGSLSKVSRMESGLLPFRPRDVEQLLALYGVTDPAEQDLALALARESARPGWWDAWEEPLAPHIKHALAVEAAASLITVYDAMAVPALLQTPAYAMTIAASTSVRPPRRWRGGLSPSVLAHRQELMRAPARGKPRLWALIDESVLHRHPGGDAGVMAAQVALLIKQARRDRVRVQIVPRDSPDTLAAAGPFTLLSLDRDPAGQPADQVPDIVLVEQQTTLQVLDRPRDVDHYRAVLQRIQLAAVYPEASLELLQTVADSLPVPG